MTADDLNRVYNFCSGPAAMPRPVMQRVQRELTDYQGSGLSIMEVSHRSEFFLQVLEQAEQHLRTLLDLPEHYRILFMQGGASLQFSAVPLNLAQRHKHIGFIDTGYWSKAAQREALRYAKVTCLASGFDAFRQPISTQNLPLDYVHYTPNETIDGIEFHSIPEFDRDVLLVADMSSCILSEPIPIERFGLVYAGAQKNIGPAGLGVVIVREDLLGLAAEVTPRLLNYSTVLEHNNMANTPPTFAIYVAQLVFEWLLEQGGLLEMAHRNKCKAELLYSAIDQSAIFTNNIPQFCRSRMNVPFQLPSEAVTRQFLSLAEQRGLHHLQGHRSAGGIRASIYNAMPERGVQALVDFMREFERQHVG